jgi:hypothetical protein
MKRQIEITGQDKDLLLEMMQAYQEKLDRMDEGRSTYISLAHITNEIASAGKKYEDNIRFFEVSDTIKSYISEQKLKAVRLYQKVLNFNQ